MRSHTYFVQANIQLGAIAFVFTFFLGCQRPYSPAAYRKQSESQKYAIICHDNKRTLRVPAEDWEAHKAHGDYRGPCRTRKLAGERKPTNVKNTLTSYDKAKSRSEESYERWAAEQEVKNAYIDSLKAIHAAGENID